VRIGAAPVYTAGKYKTAADLPRYAFVLATTMFATFLGFVIAYVVTTQFRRDKRKQWLYEQLKEEKRSFFADKQISDVAKDKTGMNLQGMVTCYNDAGGAYGTMRSPTMPPTMGGMPGTMSLNAGPVNSSLMPEMMMSQQFGAPGMSGRNPFGP